MKTFMNDEFLLESKVASDLYHRFAEPMPIIDYHCHLSPDLMASDHRFRSITEIWLDGDHYKWRAMRSDGVPERYCTGEASDWEKFEAWAHTVPFTLRNPLYHWTHLELSRYFGVTEKGNFTDHSHPHPLPNQNVLSIANPKLSKADKALLASAKRKLLEARARRVRPHRDDKVLASWNGLMLGALAAAYATLNDPAYRDAAEKNLAFVQRELWDAASNTLFHRWRDGERDQVQLLEGYAFLLSGTLELYEATLNPG